MTGPEGERLSRISTQWSLVFRAHDQSGADKKAAQTALLRRYCGAVYRYVRSVVPDAHAAEDLCQEFAYRFVRGDFHNADPAVGRFRNFVKTAVAHLIADWRRRCQAGLQAAPYDHSWLTAVASPELTADDKFEELWRAELLDRAWEQLDQLQRQESGQSWFYTALRFRAENPEMSSAEMAEQLGRQLGRPITAENVRTTLKRAREKFAAVLVNEVAHSLQTSTPDELRAEVANLGLLPYCQPALDQHG
jgi:RNA polymerase sigma factor (sigma-70 family)